MQVGGLEAPKQHSWGSLQQGSGSLYDLPDILIIYTLLVPLPCQRVFDFIDLPVSTHFILLQDPLLP